MPGDSTRAGRRAIETGLPLGYMTPDGRRRRLALLVGWSAAVFSALYWLSDVLEATDGGFSDGQLHLTLVAEAAIPPIVLGLWRLQRHQLGRLGAVSACAYAWAYVFFTFTVIYALAEGSPDFSALSEDLGPSMALHGAIMLVAGIGLGASLARTDVLPSWTGWLLAAGVVALVATQGAPAGVQLASSALRDAAFVSMGIYLIRRRAILAEDSRHCVTSRPERATGTEADARVSEGPPAPLSCNRA